MDQNANPNIHGQIIHKDYDKVLQYCKNRSVYHVLMRRRRV